MGQAQTAWWNAAKWATTESLPMVFTLSWQAQRLQPPCQQPGSVEASMTLVNSGAWCSWVLPSSHPCCCPAENWMHHSQRGNHPTGMTASALLHPWHHPAQHSALCFTQCIQQETARIQACSWTQLRSHDVPCWEHLSNVKHDQACRMHDQVPWRQFCGQSDKPETPARRLLMLCFPLPFA